MVVSMIAVGPVGATGALAWLVVLGASGSASADDGGGDEDCPNAGIPKANTSAR